MKRFNVPESQGSYSESSDSESFDGSQASGSGSSGVEEAAGPKPCHVGAGLLVNNLAMLHDGEKEDTSCYAKNGKDPKRVKTAMTTGCCTRNCKKNLSFRTVLRVVVQFWALSKSAQDVLLWSIQQRSALDSLGSLSDAKSDADLDDLDDSASSDSGSSVSCSSRRVRCSWSIEG